MAEQKVITFIGGPKDGFKVRPLGSPPFIVDTQHQNHRVRYVLTKKKIKEKEKLFYVLES
jgi:hypothetical protein